MRVGQVALVQCNEMAPTADVLVEAGDGMSAAADTERELALLAGVQRTVHEVDVIAVGVRVQRGSQGGRRMNVPAAKRSVPRTVFVAVDARSRRMRGRRRAPPA